jgi:multidrug resistance efflux pump
LVTSKSRLQQAKVNVGDTNIKSTINGILIKAYEPGSVLGAGTPMFEIVNVSKLRLKVSINENQVAGLKSGNTVAVTASVYPDAKFVENHIHCSNGRFKLELSFRNRNYKQSF